jgi:hypothetical protein
MTPLTFFRLSLILPFVIPLGNLPPTIFGAMIILAIKYSGVAYALTIPLLWWLLGSEVSTSLLLAILLMGAVIVFAYMCALLILVGSALAVWLRIVKPPVAA